MLPMFVRQRHLMAEIATPDMGDIQRQLSQFEGRLTSRADTLIALAQRRFELTTHKLSAISDIHTARERLRQQKTSGRSDRIHCLEASQRQSPLKALIAQPIK